VKPTKRDRMVFLGKSIGLLRAYNKSLLSREGEILPGAAGSITGLLFIAFSQHGNWPMESKASLSLTED
jgi:hypothetical protein